MQRKIADLKSDTRAGAEASDPQLRFVDEPGSAAAWIAACRSLAGQRGRRIGLRPLDEAQIDILRWIAGALGDNVGLIGVADRTGEGLPAPIAAEEADAIVLLGGDADAVSAALMEYIDDMATAVVAPVTARHWQRLPLYLISIPKAGTHLLFQLAEALGYKPGGPTPHSPTGGYWYYLLNTNAHTGAGEFFQDALQKAPFGNRAHPFMRSPALFNYRNPLDILVSEANYYHLDGKSPLSVMLSTLSFEERVDKLIDDPWLLGSIRGRVGRFAAWLDCANVIPVSFEEMVGAAGGGSEEALERLIWSLQLKLHVPGNPAQFRAALKQRESPTFREGRIGGWRSALDERQIERLEAMPQDFMAVFGYDTAATRDGLPATADTFRRQAIRLSKADFSRTPILVRTGVLGHNVVSFSNRYFAVPSDTGELDLASLSEAELARFAHADTLADVTAAVIAREAVDAEIARLEPHIEPAPASANPDSATSGKALPTYLFSVADTNVVRHGPVVYGVRQRLGPIDFELGADTLRALYAREDLIVDRSPEAVAAAVAMREIEQVRQAAGEAAARLPLQVPDAVDALYPALLGRVTADVRDAVSAPLAVQLQDMQDKHLRDGARQTQSQIDRAGEALREDVLGAARREIQAQLDRAEQRAAAAVRVEVVQQIEAAYPALLERLRLDVHNAIYSPLAGDLHRELTRVMTPQMQGLLQTELQAALDRERTGPALPRGAFLGYNLFRRRDAMLAVPRSLGAVDPLDSALGKRPGVIAARNGLTARGAILWRWVRWAYWDGAKI